MWKSLRIAGSLFLLMTLLTGIVYPLVVTAAAHILFPHQATESIIITDGRAVGSELIGQSFVTPDRFWGRPSATAAVPYNALAGAGSNLGPTNLTLVDAVQSRIAALQAADPENQAAVPIDLVTASGSGLDPHISPAAAYYQVARVAKALKLDEHQVRELVDRYVEPPTLGLFGAARVNVLRLNMALDGLTP